MSTPKPHIRAKGDPPRRQTEIPLHDPSVDPDRNPPVFTERDPGWNLGDERVLFDEDDCLR